MPRKPRLIPPSLVLKTWENVNLSRVITLSEACILFNRSKTAIKFQIDKGNIMARGSITGGDILIDLESISKLYKLERDDLTWLIK